MKDRKKSLVGVNIFCSVLIVLSILYLSFNLFFIRIYVVGSSMEYTLHGAEYSSAAGGDFVYVYVSDNLERGDIVVIDEGDTTIIKRVIAVGGDTVELRRGQLYLNGVLTEEEYVTDSNNDPDEPVNTFAPLTVPQGTVFCMGDNRNVSQDSRGKYGCIAVEKVIGKAAGWSLLFKDAVTAVNTFFVFTLPSWLNI